MSLLMQSGQALQGENDEGLANTQQGAKKSPATSGDEALPAVDRVRRSGRVRSSNQSLYGSYVHFDATLPIHQGLLFQPGSDSDDEQHHWAVSPECQASVTAWRPRPAQPTASEAKFLQAARVYPLSSSVSCTPADDADTAAAAARTAAAAATAVAGGILDMSAREFQALCRATVPKDRAALLASTVAAMDQQLGPHLVKVLQLDTLGSKRIASWQPHEELLFCLGMCNNYRMFKSMRRLFLKTRSVHDLNGYYHNVWKTRSTPEADEFLSLREANAGEREVWVFEQGIRDRLKAMWQPAFGDVPVSAAGPAPLRQRLARMTYVKVTPAAALSAPAATPAAAPVRKPTRTPASTGGRVNSPLVSPAGGGRRVAAAGSGRSSPGGTLRPPAAVVDMHDPAALAALPAQLPAAATIAPRPGAFVLSSTAGGRMRLTPGVTHVGAAGQQQQQQQPALAPVPQPQRPTHGSIQAQQQKQRQRQQGQQQQPQAACTLLLVPLPQLQQQQQQQHTLQQLVRLMPTQPKQPAIAPLTPAGAAGSRLQPAADVAGARPHAPAADTVQAPQQQRSQQQQQQLPPVNDGLRGQFPEMPRMPPNLPLPDAADPAALAAWLQALRGCRAAMARFKQQVDATAEAALLDVQRRISAAQQQQAQALGQAEQYLQELSSTEARLVSCMQQAPAAHTGGGRGTQQAQQQQGKVEGRQQGHTPHGDVLLSTEAPLSPRVAAKQPLGDLELAVLQLLQGAGSGKKRRQQQQHPGADAVASQLAKKQNLAAAGPCSQAAAAAAAASAVIVID